MSYNPNLSPTALLVAIASDFRDAAMKDAYEAEGTDREADAELAEVSSQLGNKRRRVFGRRIVERLAHELQVARAQLESERALSFQLGNSIADCLCDHKDLALDQSGEGQTNA